jgi:hypothetical protein
VVLDLRAPRRWTSRRVEEAIEVLDALDAEPDIEARFGFHRVVALVSGEGDRTDRLIARLGARRLGRILRGPPGRRLGRGLGRLPRHALDEMSRLLLESAGPAAGPVLLGRRDHRHLLRAGRAQVPGRLPASPAGR